MKKCSNINYRELVFLIVSIQTVRIEEQGCKARPESRITNDHFTIIRTFSIHVYYIITPSIYRTIVGTYLTKHKPGGLSNELEYLSTLVLFFKKFSRISALFHCKTEIDSE